MFIVLEDTILNMDHVSRIVIEVHQTDDAVVMAEYAPPIYNPHDDRTFREPQEFQIELYRGTEETCKQFLAGFDTMLNSDRKSITIKSMKEKAFTGYRIKGIDGDRVPKEYDPSRSYTVYILLEAVEDDDWCVTPSINSDLKKIWIEHFNQLASDRVEQYKNGPESSAYPLSGIKYYKDEEYEALKVCGTNFEVIRRWQKVLKNLVEAVCRPLEFEIYRRQNFKFAADGINSECFTESP